MSKLDDLNKTIDSRNIPDEIDRMLKEKGRTIPETKKREEPQAKETRNETTEFTNEDKKRTVGNLLAKYKNKKIKLRKQEERLIKNLDYDTMQNTRGLVLGLAVIGLIFLVLIRNFLPNDAMYTMMILIGGMLFMPVGMIAGWILFDPVMRCKILRKTTKRNYGITNFVGKGKKMVSKIKNLDYGLIWRDNECWVLTKDKIYQLTKDGNAANDGYTLDPDSVVTLVDTVPVIFIDMDSMEPLSIIQTGREPVYPMEIGSTLKAWIDNQRAKMMQTKKAMDILLLVAVIAGIGAMVVSFYTMSKVDELAKTVNTLGDKIITLLQQSQLPP